MSFIEKPKIAFAGLPRNQRGLTLRDYEGGMSTLCAGCGHDSISAAIVRACYELNLAPERVAKLSGIGCSSKTPAYFLRGAHGVNAVHGRMPAVATGASAGNRDLYCIGVSGDGDSLSIGLGQFAHAVRRNLNMLYIIENNGVYGLTKGQFSASADVGTRAKKGDVNEQPPIDPVSLTLTLGGTFIGRGFSGDKEQLVPLIKAGLMHRGFALLDVLSPCVTFNDHEASTKSYVYTRAHSQHVVFTDFVPPQSEITAGGAAGEVVPVTLHDGSRVLLKKVTEDYDPTDRAKVYSYLHEHQGRGQIPTGLLFIDKSKGDMHDIARSVQAPLAGLPYESLCPGAAALEEIQQQLR